MSTLRELPQRPLSFLLHYARRRPWSIGALLALMVTAALCSVGVQYGMKLIVDAMATGDRGSSAITQALTLFIVLIALESVLWRLGGWLGCHVVVGTGVDMRLDLFGHLSGHAVGYFGDHLAGALGNRITATAGASGAVFGALIWQVIPPVTDFIGALVVLVVIQPSMALALLVFVLIVAAAVLGYGGRGKPLHLRYAEEGARVNGELVDSVTNIWTVKAFSARRHEVRRLEAAFRNEAGAQRSSWLYLEKTRVLHDVCLWVMAGTMLAWAVHSWRLGQATPGDVVLISALTFRILHGSRDLALAVVGLTQHLGVIGEMLGVIARRHGVEDAPAAPRFEPRGGDVRLHGVSFAYDARAPVLHDFDLHVPAGQRLGIVGPSGAGKSTLLGLLQRLADPQHGRLLIDGQAVHEVTQESLRRAIAVVPQDVSLFHRSVLENIRYGRPSATRDEVESIARIAHCDDFIRELPHGYDTVVGERGAKLSGGQRQRIGIARALLSEPPVLLFDEATSALDSRSEQQVQLALTAATRGRTVIAVAHRLSTVSTFDRIVVMSEGRIVEDGTPQALREARGLFSQMWRLQAEGLRAA